MDTKEKLKELIGLDGVIITVLIAFSFLGVALTNALVAQSHWMWTALAPLYGLGLGFIEWRHAEDEDINLGKHILKHVLHWGGVVLVIQLLYFLAGIGLIAREGTGLVALLIFIMSTFLAAVHLDWRFLIVAVFLVGEMFVIAFWEEYDGVLIGVAIGLVALYAGVQIGVRKLRKKADASPSA